MQNFLLVDAFCMSDIQNFYLTTYSFMFEIFCGLCKCILFTGLQLSYVF